MLSKTHTKYIQSLQHKKSRDEAGLFIAEGPKVVIELLENGNFACKEILALKEWLDVNARSISKYPVVAVTELKDFELEKISALSTPHHVLAIFEKKKQPAGINVAGKITLVLDTIQDPGNMGTIIRIADWFGVDHIICSEGCADMYNPKVVQSTMGSLGRVSLVYTDIVRWLKENKGPAIYAAALSGREMRSLGKLKEGMIVIGNEAHGISEEVLQLVNEKITIPGTGRAESLNAAVATGIILSHIR